MKRILILGAAGRDFHDFNVIFRYNPDYHVVAFTASQIPDIANRRYPPELAGNFLYPDGIPIFEEKDLEKLIANERVDAVVFAYSDISHQNLMHLASRVVAAGADFWLLGTEHTQLKSSVPVVSICAVRTGCGKSPLSRLVASELRRQGWKPVVIRHPMPYGDLAAEAVQRFATLEDLDFQKCTIEEREEYEPHIRQGTTVDAGAQQDIETVRHNVHISNPKARILETACRVSAPTPELVKGKRVLVVEDGPTLTHGEMPYGAGVVAARKWGAAELVCPKPYAVGSIRGTFERFPHLTNLLPAMGYSVMQRHELEETINSVPCDLVLIATPIDLARVIKLSKPSLRVTYEVEELTHPGLAEILAQIEVPTEVGR